MTSNSLSWRQAKQLLTWQFAKVGVTLDLDVQIESYDIAAAQAERQTWKGADANRPIDGLAFWFAAARILTEMGANKRGCIEATDYLKRVDHLPPTGKIAESFMGRLGIAKSRYNFRGAAVGNGVAVNLIQAPPVMPPAPPAPAPAPTPTAVLTPPAQAPAPASAPAPRFDDAGLIARVEAALAAGTLAEAAAEVLLGLPGGADRPAVLAALKAAGLGLAQSLAAARVWFSA